MLEVHGLAAGYAQVTVLRDIDLTVAVDRSQTIRQSLHDTEATLVIAVFLVILVVFAFLRSVRAAAIPSIAVPTSIIDWCISGFTRSSSSIRPF